MKAWELKNDNVKFDLSLEIIRVVKPYLNSRYEDRLSLMKLFELLNKPNNENLLITYTFVFHVYIRLPGHLNILGTLNNFNKSS